MREKQPLWIGFLTWLNSSRTWASLSATGRRFCLGRRIFFRKERPIAVERAVVEKPDAIVVGLERPTRYSALTQADKIAAHLLLAEQVGRASEMRRQSLHGFQIGLLRARCQLRQHHVIDHSLAQGCHRILLRWNTTPATAARASHKEYTFGNHLGGPASSPSAKPSVQPNEVCARALRTARPTVLMQAHAPQASKFRLKAELQT